MKILVNVPLRNALKTFFPDYIRDRINAAGEVIWNEGDAQFTPEELAERLPGVELMFTAWGSTKLTDDVLPAADSLKLVAHTGGTTAGLVCDAAYDKGIKVSSGNEMYAESVAEGCVAYFLAALRELPMLDRRVHAGAWRMAEEERHEGLLDQTVGLVGLGTISKYLIGFLKPFRCRIKVVSQYTSDADLAALGVERATLEEVFTTCKIVSVHLAKNPSTYRRVSRELLESMPDHTIFVNTARGACVDEEALIDVLQKNTTIRAVLDVFDVEPLPHNHKLTMLGNVILQPHVAGPTRDRRPMITGILLGDAVGFLSGKPLQYEIPREQAAYMTR
jgi:phosphoglycerate dehydrogenase-like enzyme